MSVAGGQNRPGSSRPPDGYSPSEAPLGELSGVLRARSGHFGTKYLPASSLLTAESSAGRISASRCGLRVGSSACTSTPDKNGLSKIRMFSVSKGQKLSRAASMVTKEPSDRRLTAEKGI